MDSSGTERRRALSFSGLSSVGTKLSIGLGSETDHPNMVRIRHPSFALATERPSILDGLIGAASNKIRGPTTDKDAIPDGTNSSSIKSSSTSSYVQCPAEASQTKEPLTVQVIAALDDVDEDVDSRRTSSATVIAPLFEWDGYSSPVGSKHTLNTGSLSSAVLKLYLSQLSHENENENSGKTAITPLGSATPCSAEPQSHDVHVPECFRLHVPAVASMTMPVNQITRAYSRFYGDSSRFGRNIPTVTVHPLYERNALTDANYSSGLSDSDSHNSPKSRGKPTCGYQSDHHMIEAASEARKLQMTGRRLEQDFHRSTASLSSSPSGRPRPHSGNSTPITKRRISNSARNSKFDLTQVYDGLLPQKTPISPSPSSEWSVSNGSLDATLLNRLTPPLVGPPTAKSGCITPPGSPISAEAFGPMRSTLNEQCSSSNAPTTLDRLRSMLSNFKQNLHDDESSKYFYMDEQSLERRAQAQVSNVIAPVSF